MLLENDALIPYIRYIYNLEDTLDSKETKKIIASKIKELNIDKAADFLMKLEKLSREHRAFINHYVSGNTRVYVSYIKEGLSYIFKEFDFIGITYPKPPEKISRILNT